MLEKKGLSYAPPLRVWEPTGNFTADGKRMFASREWGKGEKIAYMQKLMMDMSKVAEEGGTED